MNLSALDEILENINPEITDVPDDAVAIYGYKINIFMCLIFIIFAIYGLIESLQNSNPENIFSICS